ncbi:hypothetical protein ASF73_20625 [Xanthomonas sp. Leaf131]|nr:hypothetical protein ASF73_20625 [Xanthomonas sp. Leaf131]
MQVQIAGIPWFQEDDYETFRSLLPDRDWHDSYADWKADAEQSVQRLNDKGIRTIKAELRSADFAAWCRSTGRKVDTKALLAFGNDAAQREIADKH